MKTNLLKSAVLVASLLGALGSASAETLHARIPFGFSAGGKAMPAGAYSISTIPGAPSVLLFENETTKMQAIVFVRTDPRTPANPATPLGRKPEGTGPVRSPSLVLGCPSRDSAEWRRSQTTPRHLAAVPNQKPGLLAWPNADRRRSSAKELGLGLMGA